LDRDSDSYRGYTYCTFNLEGELILYYDYNDRHKIFIYYSTQTKNNKWKCKKIYKIRKDFEDFTLISISKYNIFYLFSNNSIYEWNLITEKSIKMLVIDEDKDNKVLKYIVLFTQIYSKIFHN
jgi:hypothetical protein